MYALFGLVLLALRRVSEKWLWMLFGASFLYPVAAGLYRLWAIGPAELQQIVALASEWTASNNAAYGSGSFLAAAIEHTRETFLFYTEPRFFLRMFSFYMQLFTTMVLGLILGRRHFFENAASHLDLVRRVQSSALAIGIVTGAIYGYRISTTTGLQLPSVFGMFANVCYVVCRVSIMTFYVATIVRAMHNAEWRPRLMPIATVGRMPLTNYLLQTLIATSIFYGWGLGFWGRVGPALQVALAIAIYFVIQVPLSRWWLNRFALGPMEYLWRSLTYGGVALGPRTEHDEAARQH